MKGVHIAKALSTITVLILLAAVASPAMAQEDEFFYQRAISEKYTVQKAEIISAVATPQGSDWLLFVMDTKGDEDKGLGVGVIYGHGTADTMTDATASFIAPFGIIEFKDDGDGKFDADGDDVISAMPLHADMADHEGFEDFTGETNETMIWYDRPDYKPITHERIDAPAGGIGVTVAAETVDGVFEMLMHVSNSVIFNADVILSPYEVKIDFIINDYPYVENDTIIALLNIIAVGNAVWYNGLPQE